MTDHNKPTYIRYILDSDIEDSKKAPGKKSIKLKVSKTLSDDNIAIINVKPKDLKIQKDEGQIKYSLKIPFEEIPCVINKGGKRIKINIESTVLRDAYNACLPSHLRRKLTNKTPNEK